MALWCKLKAELQQGVFVFSARNPVHYCNLLQCGSVSGSKNHQLQTLLLSAKRPRCQTAENQEEEEIKVEEESRRCGLAVPIVTED